MPLSSWHRTNKKGGNDARAVMATYWLSICPERNYNPIEDMLGRFQNAMSSSCHHGYRIV